MESAKAMLGAAEPALEEVQAKYDAFLALLMVRVHNTVLSIHLHSLGCRALY